MIAATVVVAFLERWWFPFAWKETASLTSVFYYGDATRFVDYARAIAQGRLYDNGIPFHPPGWPLVLAALFRWTGAAAGGAIPVAGIKLMTAAVSAISIGVAALLAGEVAGLGALTVVALAGPFDFGHIVEGTVANSEAMYGLFVTLAVWASWRWLRDEADNQRAWVALTAAVTGSAMLIRAEFLAGAIATMAIAWRWHRPRFELGLYAVIVALVLTPSTVWHWRTLSAFNDSHVRRVAGPLPRFAPVTSYGPFNFAMANHEDADGGPNRDHPMLERCQGDSGMGLEAGQLDLACPAIYDLYVSGYRIGALWLLNNPGRALTLVGHKIAFTIGFLAHGFFADDIGVGVTGIRRRVDLVDPERGWLIPVRVFLIAVGIIALVRRPLALAVLAAPLAALLGSVILFYGYVRLGIAYLPIVYVLIGTGLATIVYTLTGRAATRRTILFAILAIAVGAGYERTIRDADRPLVVQGSRRPDGTLQQDETIDIRRP